jgi:hypothetical protein
MMILFFKRRKKLIKILEWAIQYMYDLPSRPAIETES